MTTSIEHARRDVWKMLSFRSLLKRKKIINTCPSAKIADFDNKLRAPT